MACSDESFWLKESSIPYRENAYIQNNGSLGNVQ